MKRTSVGIGAAAAAMFLMSAMTAHATAVTLARTEIAVDYVSSGVGGIGSGPGTITVSGVTGTVKKAFLYWHGINNSAAGAIYDNPTVTLNDTPVTGISLGDAATNCWGDGSSRGFFADVTSLVPGNGGYVVSGLNATTGHNGNGASLVVVFDDGNASNNRDLVFFEGNDSDYLNYPIPGDSGGWQATLNNINYGGGSVLAQAHASDGQDFSDDIVTFQSGAGSVTITDTGALWDGISVPNAGFSRAPNGGLWDIHTFDITGAFGAAGPYTLDFGGMYATGDCHSLVVMMIDLASGAAPCGNGILDDGEECDPATPTSSCVQPESCLTNCTCGCATDFDCNDGIPCTVDSCDSQTGACLHDTSQPGSCDDNDPCTVDACTAQGCEHTPVSCDDQNACTTDLCTADGCFHSPITCDDQDPCTEDFCYPISGTCFHTNLCTTTTTTLAPTTTSTTSTTLAGACCAYGQCYMTSAGQCEVGTYQGDGSSCEEPGICAVCGDGIVSLPEQCDDANTAAGDGCDGKCNIEQCWTCISGQAGPALPYPAAPGASICTPDDGAKCTDGDLCTVGDTCAGGTCGGSNVVLPAACNWVIVGDSDVQSRTRGQTAVTGHICGGRVRLGEFSTTNGDAVATLSSGVSMLISGHADVAGDIVTGGGAVRGKPRRTLLPGLNVDVVAGGATAVQSGDPDSTYDTLGTDDRIGDCTQAQSGIAAAESMLDGSPAGTNLGDALIAAGGTLTLTASNPGGLNVFDFRTLISAADGKIVLDGSGDPGSVFVLRVQRRFDLRLRSKLLLAGGTQPGNVILYSQGKCRFGLEVVGEGTVFCPNSRLQLQARTQWNGALVGGRRRVDVRDSAVLTHAPLQIGQ